jgi:hypothetical protein
MNGKPFQFNRRAGVALGLASLILSMTALPALAWSDEGSPDFQPVRSCQVRVVGEGLSHVGCARTQLSPTSPVISERPIAPPGVVRAEKFFLQNWQPAQAVVEVSEK